VGNIKWASSLTSHYWTAFGRYFVQLIGQPGIQILAGLERLDSCPKQLKFLLSNNAMTFFFFWTVFNPTFGQITQDKIKI